MVYIYRPLSRITCALKALKNTATVLTLEQPLKMLSFSYKVILILFYSTIICLFYYGVLYHLLHRDYEL